MSIYADNTVEMIQYKIERCETTTHFFRHPAAFTFLRRRFRGSATPVRIASVACSSGMEPYSIAMAFMKAPLPVVISAYDARQAMVDAGNVATYELEDPYFKTLVRRARSYCTGNIEDIIRTLPNSEKGHVRFSLGDKLKKAVTFARHDIYSNPLPQTQDAILLMNMLYHYSEVEDRLKILENCKNSLSNNGFLICEPFEGSLKDGYDYLMEDPQDFGFKHFRPDFIKYNRGAKIYVKA